MYGILYCITKIVVTALIRVLPVEFFNRLCLVLPGRLIQHGLRQLGASIGENVKFMPPVVFHNFSDHHASAFRNLTIGNNCFFGRNSFFDVQCPIIIRDNVSIAMGVMLITHTDVGASPLKQGYLPSTKAAIVIGEGAYIGARATVLQGVEVGREAIIGAGALVRKPVPDHTVWGGVPARQIGTVRK